MRKIQDKFVPYNLALELKYLGFDEPCFAKYYQQDGSDGFIQIGESEIEEAESAGDDVTFECDAPLWQDAFEWFREQHSIDITNYLYNTNEGGNTREYQYEINLSYGKPIKLKPKSYKDARLETLEKLIQYVKQNK